MDLVRGRSLMALLQKSVQKAVRIPVGVVCALMIEALEALDHAHAAQIVHRDLTPSNLIVTDQGHVKVIDFGVAKALVGSLQTQSGLAKGKLGYMALEVLSGKHVDPRADVFSAGVVAWELIALQRLFHAENDIEVMNAINAGVVEPPSRFNPECPPLLDAIVLRALQRSRESRWESAAEMAEALGELRVHYPATERDVLHWVDDLYSDTDAQLSPLPHEESSSYGVAYGYEPGTYDDLEIIAADANSKTYEDLGDLTEQPEHAHSAFLDMDTVLSTYSDRKR